MMKAPYRSPDGQRRAKSVTGRVEVRRNATIVRTVVKRKVQIEIEENAWRPVLREHTEPGGSAKGVGR
jgi:hypothetical protein